ncbi:serine/threonine protein kinase [Methanolobus vulcani]|jgi:RIO kinase 1|uniref:non-specific serine/threonine protein kinase n=1 Tax=Methanolobus vulcani TaxID=38026 RepID=A0A7Z7B1U1_9EURY|nr:serine protein kinase RIO [Methanolobus vulcani]MDK2826653.1 kinase 1 [Methanolobus sp.]SDG30833.1 serine/threonine protein kinase [Methanolobus vulcani]
MKKEVTSKVKRIDTRVDKLRMKRKDTDTLKVKENVFDEPTLKTLYTLSNKGIIEAIGGSISTGKEANVFLAEDTEKDIAVKIYRISSSTFNSMEDYILGDPRFRNVRHSKRDIIFAWTKKEQRNLVRAKEAGLKVPEPFVAERNILVMEFMGEDGIPYPQLKDYRMEKETAKEAFDTIINYIDLLYNEANLVHGDLSEYNILIIPETEEPVFIDMGQSVTREHPRSIEFLIRDIENITRYFKKYSISADPHELYKLIRNKEAKNEENDL